MKRQTPKGTTSTSAKPPTSKPKDDQKTSGTFKAPEIRTPRQTKKTCLGPPLSKTYMSKSHDNLASVLRRKATTGSNGNNKARPKSTAYIGLPDQDGDSDTTSVPSELSPQRTKRNSEAGITRPVPTTGGIKKASSTQNISKQASAVKRAASTQNVSRDKSGRQRISAPANIMAYNAELLASFEKERKNHEEKISELRQCAETRKTELEKCRFEIKRLKEVVSEGGDHAEEMSALKHENKLLKDKLIEAGVSVEHFTDTEKLSRLERERMEAKQDSMSGTSDSTCRSKQPNVGSSRGGEIEGFDTRSIDSDFGISEPDATPDQLDQGWDRPSNKSTDALSDVSVACLQDRILQMEETHYSTNEELQATLQELCDLQNAVNDLSNENERLADEKGVLLESLCAQTEKLEHCRIQIEHLKSLLLNENHTHKAERERQLLEIIKAAQVERDEMLLRQTELSYSLHNSELYNRENQEVIMSLKDDVRLLEDRMECLLREKRHVEAQRRELQETINTEYIEVQKYKLLLENEKTKVVELQQYKNAADKTEVESLLDNALDEKKKLELRCADLQEQLAVSRCDIHKLNDQISCLEEECKVNTNNAKMSLGDMEYKFRQIAIERDEVKNQSANLREHIEQLEQDCERYLEEKKSFTNQIIELKKRLEESDYDVVGVKREMAEAARRHEEEGDDWRQFQSDLQKAVVIANDIKMEAQQDMELALNEKAVLKEKLQNASQEISRLKTELESLKDEKEESRLDLRGRVMSSVDREFTLRQQNRKGNQQNTNQHQSVKNLIKSIETQVKQTHVPLSPTSAERQLSESLSPSSPAYLDLSPATSPSRTPSEVRRASMPAESCLKPVLKKLSMPDEKPMPMLKRDYTPQLTVTEMTRSPPPGMVGTSNSSGSDGGDIGNVGSSSATSVSAPLSSLLSTSAAPTSLRRNSMNEQGGRDPLASLVKTSGGSKRNALLKWCQSKTINYKGIDITNFSSSWNDGLAFCALMHSYLPDTIPYHELSVHDKRRNFTLAFKAAESVGISSTLSLNDMVAMERPDWQAVMSYVTAVYKHFELK